MKRTWKLSIAVALLAGHARAEDEWWGTDKALHFTVSAALAGGGYGVSSLVVEPRWQRFGLGVSGALTLGAAKELYDASGHGNASYRDLVWDAAGAVVGASLALLVDVALDGPQTADDRSSSSGALSIRW